MKQSDKAFIWVVVAYFAVAAIIVGVAFRSKLTVLIAGIILIVAFIFAYIEVSKTPEPKIDN